MESFGMATVVVLTVISYLVGEAVKLIPNVPRNYIPVICGFVGGALGAVAMHIVPDYPANDYLTAIAVGIVSGFGATGVHQVYKQIYDTKDEVEE